MKHNAIGNAKQAGRQKDRQEDRQAGRQTGHTRGNLALPVTLIAKCKGAYLDLQLSSFWKLSIILSFI
jgi:hypothetical protein